MNSDQNEELKKLQNNSHDNKNDDDYYTITKSRYSDQSVFIQVFYLNILLIYIYDILQYVSNSFNGT